MSTATLQIEKKKMVVPQLRFKGFDVEWELNKLGEVAQFKAGYAFKSEQMLAKKSNYQLLKMSNVYQNELRLDRNPSFWNTIDAKQKEFLLKKGDSILTLTGTVGKKDYGYSIKIEDDNKYLLNQRLVLLREIQNKSDNGFINYLISTEKFLFYFFGEAKGGTGNQTNVSTEDVKNIKLNIPPLSEQQKIASFLSAVDEKIQQLSRKAVLLEQYKKGVMQQLFSGKLRFKDENGKDYPDWEEKKLGDIGTLKNGLNKDKTDFGFGSPFVNLMNVFGKSEIYNQEFDLVNSNEKEKILYNVLKGDVLFIRSSVKRSGVGETVIVQEDLLDTVYSGFLIRFRDDRKSLAQEFKKYCFSSQSFRDEILSYATSSANTNINQESLNKINIKLPCIEEQQKIANFLSSIDTKIESTNQQLNQTQCFKKGLLQQLFV